MVSQRNQLSINPGEFESSFGSHIRDLKSAGVRPDSLSRSARDYLRISHGDALAVLPVAVSMLANNDYSGSRAELIQYLTREAIGIADRNSEVLQCIDSYHASLEKASHDKTFRQMRERGAGFTIPDRAENGMTIWAFDGETANRFENRSPLLGLHLSHCVQIFVCGAILQYKTALSDEVAQELEESWRRGVRTIARYRLNLEFDESSLNYDIM